MVLAARYRKRRDEEVRQEARLEARKERDQDWMAWLERKVWRAWLERKADAETRGLAFDEPPPEPNERNGSG
jgi:hypothetical protein